MVENFPDFKKLVEFPSVMVFKIIGTESKDFIPDVKNVVSNILKEKLIGDITSTPSRSGKYISLSIKINVISESKLKKIYEELGKISNVKYVL